MNGENIKKRLIEMASNRPNLELPYSLVADMLGIPITMARRLVNEISKEVLSGR
ncbi:MAG: hypothetical protein ACRCVN_06115 [Spirochaetia bacterium]